MVNETEVSFEIVTGSGTLGWTFVVTHSRFREILAFFWMANNYISH